MQLLAIIFPRTTAAATAAAATAATRTTAVRNDNAGAPSHVKSQRGANTRYCSTGKSYPSSHTAHATILNRKSFHKGHITNRRLFRIGFIPLNLI
ncbi:hypothetical protein V1478_004057 [Vespula squamosa]|uniref:Secreted protein n=1 Tax=Vespula squamosa TaxID=30214 RepID=A0ABD2BNK9_VESSQ